MQSERRQAVASLSRVNLISPWSLVQIQSLPPWIGEEASRPRLLARLMPSQIPHSESILLLSEPRFPLAKPARRFAKLFQRVPTTSLMFISSILMLARIRSTFLSTV